MNPTLRVLRESRSGLKPSRDSRANLLAPPLSGIHQSESSPWGSFACRFRSGLVCRNCVVLFTLPPVCCTSTAPAAGAIKQLGAAANFDDLIKFSDCHQIRRSQILKNLHLYSGVTSLFNLHARIPLVELG